MNNLEAVTRDNYFGLIRTSRRSAKLLFKKIWAQELRGKKLRIWGSWCLVPLYLSVVRQPLSWAGIITLGSGTFLRMWASGYLRKESTLCTTGPYALSRNPLYLGSLLVAAAMPLGQQNYLLTAIVAVLFLMLFRAIIAKEEEVLTSKFGVEYRAYQASVPAFVGIASIVKIPRALGSHSLKAKTWVTNRGWEPALIGFAIFAITYFVAFFRH
jgi:protein-S-isoprenylcysteine O-methyltransferase Ste14